MGLVDLIKDTAVKAVEAGNPVNILFGTVSSVVPLEIDIHQKLKLIDEFLVITETVSRASLKQGDKVILLRVQGGRQFVILDRVV